MLQECPISKVEVNGDSQSEEAKAETEERDPKLEFMSAEDGEKQEDAKAEDKEEGSGKDQEDKNECQQQEVSHGVEEEEGQEDMGKTSEVNEEEYQTEKIRHGEAEKTEEEGDRAEEDKEKARNVKKKKSAPPAKEETVDRGSPPVYESDPKDEEYFATLSQEELEWYQEMGPKAEALRSRKVECTACHRQITNLNYPNLLRHPLLGVWICK